MLSGGGGRSADPRTPLVLYHAASATYSVRPIEGRNKSKGQPGAGPDADWWATHIEGQCPTCAKWFEVVFSTRRGG